MLPAGQLASFEINSKKQPVPTRKRTEYYILLFTIIILFVTDIFLVIKVATIAAAGTQNYSTIQRNSKNILSDTFEL